MLQPPEVFRVPLPRECSIPNNQAHSYNQGQCSRKPCRTETGPCSLSWQCCYEVGQISSIPFRCSNSSKHLWGRMIVTCECQPCEKLHAYIRGRVFSSRMHQPVVLAAILLRTEVVSFTDKNGNFFFELTTGEGEVSLTIQEVHHRPVEVDVNLRASLRPDVSVTMEYIEDIRVVDKLQLGFRMQLGDLNTSEVTGINASIMVLQRSLLARDSYDIYTGPGHVLHSLYHMDSRPDFTSSAIQSMVYRDSKGVDFSIQSHITGSLRVVGETGKALSFKQGLSALLRVAVRFDVAVKEAQVEGLHIFTYPDASSHWYDNGKVTIESVQQFQYSTWVRLSAKLREPNVLWAIGFPSRITCYIKSKVSHLMTKQEQVGLSVQLEQSMMNLDRPSFYLASAKSTPGEGVCLKAVCNLGGLLYIRDTTVGEDVYRVAVTPSIDHGVIMGHHDQVMFYDVDTALLTSNSSTPYYPTEEACVTSKGDPSGHFDFLVNISLPKLTHKASVVLPAGSDEYRDSHHVGEYCFIKVGVYDCSQYTNIQVLSYSGSNHTNLLSMSSETLPPNADMYPDKEKCLELNVMPLRAACLQYSCGSDMHVSVTSAWASEGGSKDRDQQSCRYWSSLSGLTSQMHLSDAMTSFHLVDHGRRSERSRSGLYQMMSRELAILQCQAGDVTQHAKTMDHRTGIAVTFIC